MTRSHDAEFDAYAKGYNAGLDNPVAALVGGGADAFVAVKVRWLLRRWPTLVGNTEISILDYGCGVATLLRLLRSAGVQAQMTGTDISTGMLREAALLWPSSLAIPRFKAQDGVATMLPPELFDLIVVSAVLHHIAPDQRVDAYAELHRLLRRGGHLVVFEHNPWNPVTRYVVAHTPIDEHAVLLAPPEVAAALDAGGWHDIRTNHFMFLPPRLRLMATVTDRVFGWLPMGGQYAVTATR